MAVSSICSPSSHSTPSGLWVCFPSLFHLGLFTFNPFGVALDLTFSTGFTCGYSYSTPTGLRRSQYLFPRFHLGAIISLRSLLRFTFNPYGVALDLTFSPGFTWGYSHSTPTGLRRSQYLFPRFHLGLFTFNPYGVALDLTFSPGFTWGYSHSTPTGLRLT